MSRGFWLPPIPAGRWNTDWKSIILWSRARLTVQNFLPDFGGSFLNLVEREILLHTSTAQWQGREMTLGVIVNGIVRTLAPQIQTMTGDCNAPLEANTAARGAETTTTTVTEEIVIVTTQMSATMRGRGMI